MKFVWTGATNQVSLIHVTEIEIHSILNSL
jgi:hypothetical protein